MSVRNLMRGLVALTLAVPASPVLAQCTEIARVPLIPLPTETDTDGALVCSWRTDGSWAPPEGCGVEGFEVVGWGEMPPALTFKRSVSFYTSDWTPVPLDGDGPAWSSASLANEGGANRCGSSWCQPVGYIVRTAGPVSDAACGQQTELRIRLSDAVE
ncbi:hypothetical protein HKCCE3408_00870 [Rhodobacterales bacterium HKCCE3408]|nr:hypothetical protein [Rhodobacterales bacterium HKCCE3408]